MTENETKAVKFIENIKSHATVTLDHIAKEEPNVSPLVYKGREEKANTILVMVEELKQYRAIGTPEECQAAMEKQTAKKVISFEYHNGTINYGCPVCKWKIISKINGEWCCGTFNEYCDRCGQKLDWSDEDEKI